MIDTKELQRIELEILTEFAEVCDRYGLRYCLSGGTLLGAIRHKGFIPWDDDVDVNMPRPDYMRLIELAPDVFDGDLSLVTMYDRERYYHPFARLCDNRTVYREATSKGCEMGVNIDIFPIDGLPAGIRESNLHFIKIDILHKLRTVSVTKKLHGRSFLRSLVKVPAALFGRVFGTGFWLRRKERLARKYDYETSDYVAVLVSGQHGNRERLDRPSYENYVKVDFEGRQFNAPSGFECYLRNCYGDYMQLPPESERQPRHLFEAWWK